MERIRNRINRLYGPNESERLLERMVALIGRYGVGLEGFGHADRWDETTSVLITYGDMVQNDDEAPLQVFKRFADQYLSGAIHAIHFLPFFPYSSDDAFSVIDYRLVDPKLGDWKDIAEVGRGFRLMFVLVLNHASRKSKWFDDYVANIAPYRDYFIEVDPETDLSAITRPRALPLLSPVHTQHGDTHVWTTFSDDQIDLDFSNADDLKWLKDMRDQTSRFIAECARIYHDRDTDGAHALIPAMDAVLDEYDECVVAQIRSDATAQEAVPRALLCRYLKRITAHLMNVITSLVMPLERLDFYDEKKADRERPANSE